MNDADTAMYQAKQRGGGTFRILDPKDAAQRRPQDALVEALRAAVDREDLGLAYQPIVRADDGLVVGVEALLRWNHPSRGLIPAPAAVEIAERSALITDLETWLLNRACQDRVTWLADHPGRSLDLCVNVFPPQVLHPGFADSVRSALDSTGLDPSTLVLELTGGILLEDADRAQRVMADLKTTGVRLALDDFGVGFASLAKLRLLPIDVVKIDPRLVRDLAEDPASAAIVAAVANLAHLLNLPVVAEGSRDGRAARRGSPPRLRSRPGVALRETHKRCGHRLQAQRRPTGPAPTARGHCLSSRSGPVVRERVSDCSA